MQKRKIGLNKRGQKIVLIVCLSFLFGVTVGAVCANVMGDGAKGELSTFLQGGTGQKEQSSFLSIFWKYLKYDILIWAGGWMNMGLFLSGSAFFMRSISLGFTSAMMMYTYGAKGVWIATISYLPQNLILIPVYIFVMCVCIYYLTEWKDGGGKRALKRERRRKQTEYCILFGVSVVFIACGAGIELLLYAI